MLAGEINKEKGNIEVYESYLKAAKKILEIQGNTDIEQYKEISNQLNELAKDDSKGEVKEEETAEEPTEETTPVVETVPAEAGE